MTKPAPVFKVGDTVTYKHHSECPGGFYAHGGTDYGGEQGKVLEILEYNPHQKPPCYDIGVSTPGGGYYCMLESEFREWDSRRPEGYDDRMLLLIGTSY